jgi:hypothetical protein
MTFHVIPEKAGIHAASERDANPGWIPAFAGMTVKP